MFSVLHINSNTILIVRNRVGIFYCRVRILTRISGLVQGKFLNLEKTTMISVCIVGPVYEEIVVIL